MYTMGEQKPFLNKCETDTAQAYKRVGVFFGAGHGIMGGHNHWDERMDCPCCQG